MQQAIDLLIEARWVIPIEPYGQCLSEYAVAVRSGRIVELLPAVEAHAKYRAGRHLVLDQHALLPGLVNLHTHAAMNLMRGIADDLPLERWLKEAIWPMEARHMSAEFVRDGTLLAAAEMLRGGITCANDMYFYPEAAADAFQRAGMRAVVGVTILDFPTPYASDADDYLRKGLQTFDQWRDTPRLYFALAPHAPYTVSDSGFERVVALANELDVCIHTHVHETRKEIADSLTQYGMRPIARLERLGVLGPNLIAVHSVHLDEAEIRAYQAHGVGVAHNPSSNMKLGSGASPVARMLETGISVGLGSDGAASNNRLDLFQEMRQAALLAKVMTEDSTVLPAHQVLTMATLHGARALGLAHEIGSITAGKAADLCAVRLDSLETSPCYDAASHLVFTAGREQVTDVWVEGEQKVADGQLLHLNNSELLRCSRVWQNRLRG